MPMLRYNNHLAAQQQLKVEQLSSIREYFMNIFLVHDRVSHPDNSQYTLPKELCELILSYLVYQNLRADKSRMVLKSLLTPGELRRNNDGGLSLFTLPTAALAEPS